MIDQAELSAQSRTFEILGISAAEESMYRWLVMHPGSTVTEASQALGLAQDKARRLLKTVESKGLVTQLPIHPRQYLPVSPDIALETFALRREEALRRARNGIRELQEQSDKSQFRDEHASMVELITSHDLVSKTFDQMQRTAEQEIICLFRPPVYVTDLNVEPEEAQHSQRAGQRRGVRHRVIASEQVFDVPNGWRLIRDDIKSGQEYRTLSSLPFKMIVADRRVAFIPLSLEQEDSSTIIIRSPMLLEGLCALFDTLWRLAKPIDVSEDGGAKSDVSKSEWPEDCEDLIFLLAAGFSDKSIAEELGLSASTLSRRMATIGKLLGAQTRFQLGWLADRYFSYGVQRKK